MIYFRAVFKKLAIEVKLDGYIEVDKQMEKIHSYEYFEKYGELLSVDIQYKERG